MTNKIKKIHFSSYQLHPKLALSAKSGSQLRLGALLRIDFGAGEIGYADCHPWTELGDLPLQTQLQLLAQNKLTPLTKKSIYFAKMDAKHRLQHKSIFLERNFLPNHLITSYENISENKIIEAKTNGFNFIKIKCGKNLSAEIDFIQKYYSLLKVNGIKLRLDFNASLSFIESKRFFSEINNQFSIVDFVEDPCEFNFANWQEIQNQYCVNLALDKKTEKEIELIKYSTVESFNAFRVLIIKPAVENMESYTSHLPKQRIIFTSYFDHPLGQLCALAEAENFYKTFPAKKEDCGFLTHELYEPTAYSHHLKMEGIVLSATPGLGFGFDELLKKEEWILIAAG